MQWMPQKQHINLRWMLHPDESSLIFQRRCQTQTWNGVFLAIHVGSTKLTGLNNFPCWQTVILDVRFWIHNKLGYEPSLAYFVVYKMYQVRRLIGKGMCCSYFSCDVLSVTFRDTKFSTTFGQSWIWIFSCTEELYKYYVNPGGMTAWETIKGRHKRGESVV